MEVKKPSLKGMANTKHLGHFAQDKFIQQGHNSNGTVYISDLMKAQNNRAPDIAPIPTKAMQLDDFKSKAKMLGAPATDSTAMEISDLQERAKENLKFNGK